MDTRPKEANPQQEKLPPRDEQFVRNFHYEHDLRWYVQRSIPFTYENQVGMALQSIGR
jgi:hypothetical protein